MMHSGKLYTGTGQKLITRMAENVIEEISYITISPRPLPPLTDKTYQKTDKRSDS